VPADLGLSLQIELVRVTMPAAIAHRPPPQSVIKHDAQARRLRPGDDRTGSTSGPTAKLTLRRLADLGYTHEFVTSYNAPEMDEVLPGVHDWPLIGGSFIIASIDVLWPKKATERITAGGSVPTGVVIALHRHLATTFPSA
jgi:hypothetical protein